MNWREKISWFIHQKIVGRLYAIQFYVTALNTFDGGPPGVFGIEDAEKVTQALFEQAALPLNKNLPFGLMSRSKAFAKSFILATKFWHDCAQHEEKEKKYHRRKKQEFLKLLLENNVPIPLTLIFGNKLPIGLPGTLVMHTLQDLMRYVEKWKILPELNAEVVYDPAIEAIASLEEKTAFAESTKQMGSIFLVSDLSDLGLEGWLNEHLNTL